MLRCTYESLRSQADPKLKCEPFEFHPYRLLFEKRAWYVVGHYEGRDAVRTLKLCRFADIELTDKPYAIPEDFTLNEHLGQAWQMIRGEQRYDVELHFDADFAETIADTQWHPTQQIEWHDDDSITFRCTVDGLDEIVWWVLGMGPGCVVKQPAELATRVERLGKQMLARYAEAEVDGGADTTPSA